MVQERVPLQASRASVQLRPPVDVCTHLKITDSWTPERPVLSLLSFIAGPPVFELSAPPDDEYERERFFTLHSALADRSSDSPCAHVLFLSCEKPLFVRF